jgi:NADH-quinone oxidoreductase subunit F
VVVIYPERIFYPHVKKEQVKRIIEETVLKNKAVEDFLYIDPVKNQRVVYEYDIPFYKKQTRLVLRLNGLINPVDLKDYIAYKGYFSAAKTLTEMRPEQVIEEVKASGLRGRGGAGFPTGLKWEFCRKAHGDEKYLICNAEEGEPAAFMDKSILESNPHTVIEGMIITAYAIGAGKGFIYVRSEYPLPIKRIKEALRSAREAGLLGENILGSGFTFDIEIHEGGGAYVCGEETAIIASLEGKRGMPRSRPPFPAQSGYKGKPTNINNVETIANIPLIISEGSSWYSRIGTEKSKGTKIFSLAGKVKNTGLIEVPMGTTLGEIVFDIGGGIRGGRKFKAVQMGGPSGGCVPARYLNLPLDYEIEKETGIIMGAGCLIVMDENTCVVDSARYFMEFALRESCGKCVPCRAGTRQMLMILENICNGKGKEGDIELLMSLGRDIRRASLCGLGQSAPNPVLSTIRYFREEYEEHIKEKHCRAGVCEGLMEAPCSHACPAGINIPQYVGLIAEKRIDDALEVIRRRNPFVSVCGRVCGAPCEIKCRQALMEEPLAVRALERFAADNASTITKPMLTALKKEKEVAVIGAGPAGLSCAYFLALLGRSAVVYEALPIAGGMLSVGIPEFRLPEKNLEADIEFILSHGVKLKVNKPVKNLKELTSKKYKAVFIATGCHKGRSLNIKGENLSGVMDSLVFLRLHAIGQPVACAGKTVAVIGGGNPAVDAARSALRLGAKKVLILYSGVIEEMQAHEEGIEAALEEGIELKELVLPVEVLGKGNLLTGIKMIKAQLKETDENGRRKPVPGSEFTIECEMVIPATGQEATFPALGKKIKLNASGGIKTDVLTGATSMPGIFAGGDCVNGAGTVVEAIGAGRKAAVAIDRFLGGYGLLPPNVGMSLMRPAEEDAEGEMKRAKEPVIGITERRGSFKEVTGCLTPGSAFTEAGRCLRCELKRLETLQIREAK